MTCSSQFDRSSSPHRREQGAALVTGLLLLLVLTVLGISGLITATVQLQMAGNEQYQERAFQAAAGGIERAMQSSSLNTSYTPTNPLAGSETIPAGGSNADIAQFELYYDTEAGKTPVPGGGYSLGTGLQAYHFVVESEGTSARSAVDEQVQSFYVIGPSSP